MPDLDAYRCYIFPVLIHWADYSCHQISLLATITQMMANSAGVVHPPRNPTILRLQKSSKPRFLVCIGPCGDLP